MPFDKVHQERNEDVRLDHILLTKGDGKVRKPMVVVHGFFNSKTSFKPLFDDEELLEKRDYYLIDLRNGEYSDWHDDWTYDALCADIIRWADQYGIWEFELFGHSMGAKLSQVMSMKYPDRVKKVIALDGAPKRQADG